MDALITSIAQYIPRGARVLDLGCGNGKLLQYLMQDRHCSGYGVERDDAQILACVQRRVSVLQLDLEEGLSMFEDQAFDVVLQINTLQHLRNAETMLLESLRVGRQAIMAFPNFAHWKNRVSVLGGKMPVTKALPYQWYDTPNIRVGTFKDFRHLVQRHGIRIRQAYGLADDHVCNRLVNLRARTAVFVLEQGCIEKTS